MYGKGVMFDLNTEQFLPEVQECLVIFTTFMKQKNEFDYTSHPTPGTY